MSAAVMPTPSTAPGPRPAPHRFTVTEFNHMGDMGWFEGRRAFLIDGVILENGPMDPPHAVALELLSIALRQVFGAGWRHRIQMPLHVDAFNDPLPDYVVLPGAPRDGVQHPTTAPLVVEVADTSLTTDITTKAERYATAGITDYWVLDLDGRRLLVFRDPTPLPAGLGATAYRTHLTLGPADSVAPVAAPTAPVRVADLLP